MTAPTLPADYTAPVPMRRTLRTCRGLYIGGAHAARMPGATRDGERLQAALLDPRASLPLTRFQRLLGAIWRWC